MPLHNRVLLLSAFMLVLAGCPGRRERTIVCTADARIGLEVTVLGAGNPDGGTIEVVITDGDYEEELGCSPEGGSIVCSGATERAGTYRIEVIANGEVVLTEMVTVREDECHVITEQVEL